MAKPLHRARVAQVRHDLPGVVSIDVEPGDLPARDSVDDHVKIVLPPPGAPWSTPMPDPLPQDAPAALLRTYTRRRVGADGSWGIDVLLLDHDGPGRRWALGVRPGDPIDVRGPGGHFAMPEHPGTVWMVGDEVAMPAIANALEALPADAHAEVVLVRGAVDYPLPHHDGARITRVEPSVSGITLVDAVRSLPTPTGDLLAFVHGQAAMVRPLRHHLRVERGLPRDRVLLSAYWFAGRDADDWRRIKPAFVASMEAESGD